MNWIEDKRSSSVGNNETVEWSDLTLVWNGFVLVKMTVNNGKVYIFTESPKKYNDREFSFMRTFLGREDIEQVKQEIIALFNGGNEITKTIHTTDNVVNQDIPVQENN